MFGLADRSALLVVVLVLSSFLFVAGNVDVRLAGLLLLRLGALLLGLHRLDLGRLDGGVGLLGHLGKIWVLNGVTLGTKVSVQLGNDFEEILILGK